MEKIGRTKIVDLLKRTDIGAMVNVKGWVRTRRGSKQVNFIALNDGSTINNLRLYQRERGNGRISRFRPEGGSAGS